MKDEHIQWMMEHEAIFTNSVSVTIETRMQVYKIYNETFNTTKRISGCGRCWANVKKELYKKYKEINV